MSRPPSSVVLGVLVGCAIVVACASVDDDRSLRFGLPSGKGGSSSLSLGGADADAGNEPGETPAGGSLPTEAGAGGAAGSREGSMAGAATGGAMSAGGSEPRGGTSLVGGSAGVSGSEASAGNGGSSSGSANGGSAGSVGGGANEGPCGDIDQNLVQDCDETLAQNSRFELNAQNWSAEFGVSQEWKSEDARGKSGSGSLAIGFATAVGGSSWSLGATGQCLPAWSEWSYEVGARVYIPEGQAGRAELSIAAYGNDACAGSYLGTVAAAQSSQTGVWHALSGTAKAPTGTRSVLVRLAVAKPGSQAKFEAHFDDVLLRKR